MMTLLSTFLNLLYLFTVFYSWVLIIYAVMSWIPSLYQSVIGRFITQLVRPYLSLFDRIPTRLGIFDFQVVLAYVVLLVIQRFIIIL